MHDGQHELGGPAVGARGRLGVEPVLQDVEVEARELDGAELVNPLVDPVKLKPLVCGPDVTNHLVELAQGPAIDFMQRARVDAVWVEPLVILEITQQVAERVADLAIGFRHLLDSALADADVVGVVHAGDIKPQHVGTIRA